MADKPILFSAPMVRALLDGRKTQTRRVIKLNGRPPEYCGPSGCVDDPTCWGWEDADYGDWVTLEKEPGQRMGWRDWVGAPRAGDRLWVREAWRTNAMWDHMTPAELGDESRVWGRASVLFEAGGALPDSVGPEDAGRYRHARFMPRWASRITLLVTDVRVQRLQHISEADAMAEGIAKAPHGNRDQWIDYPEGSSAAGWQDPRQSFQSLWNSLHGPDAWDANPWVVAVIFDVVRGNIDQVRP